MSDRDARETLERLQAERRELLRELDAARDVTHVETLELLAQKRRVEEEVEALRRRRSEMQGQLRQVDRETNQALELAKTWRRRKPVALARPGRIPVIDRVLDVACLGAIASAFVGGLWCIAAYVLGPMKEEPSGAVVVIGAALLALWLVGEGVLRMGRRG